MTSWLVPLNALRGQLISSETGQGVLTEDYGIRREDLEVGMKFLEPINGHSQRPRKART